MLVNTLPARSAMEGGPSMRAPRAMALGELARGLGELRGDATVLVRGLALDSRAVEPGALFVARRGLAVDGHRFLADAVRRGAVALAVEADDPALPGLPVPVLKVTASDVALAHLACRFYGQPSHRLAIVGVTGTNGKTTTTHLVAGAAAAAGRRAAIFGTLGYGPAPGALTNTEHTTPPATEFQRILAELADSGMDVVAAEISSHALKTQRTLGTRYAAAVFTNLTRDHLDFHGDEADYRASKLRLFDRAARGDEEPLVAVINADDAAAPHFIAAARRSGDRVLTTSERGGADVVAEEVALGAAGSDLRVAHAGGRTPLHLALPGAYNVANALGAFAAALGLGLDADAAARGLATVERVPGRLERVEGAGDFSVLVDYAHTPDALATVLATVRQVTRGRLIAVFGCGGDRDRGKRPLMAEVGSRLADIAILTSDNPRSEDPASILAAMAAGVPAGRTVEIIADRRAAIGHAIELARGGDVVLIAGKGHETLQIVGDRRLPFDDREEARRALRARRAP
jgi:UDP-N-acetylmuramoyl-L-alanyl-D-glutamate--2,6-diaminopimelate ligase